MTYRATACAIPDCEYPELINGYCCKHTPGNQATPEEIERRRSRPVLINYLDVCPGCGVKGYCSCEKQERIELLKEEQELWHPMKINTSGLRG